MIQIAYESAGTNRLTPYALQLTFSSPNRGFLSQGHLKLDSKIHFSGSRSASLVVLGVSADNFRL